MIPESQKKIDYLGEYDEFAVPHQFETPLRLDRDNNAIACANGMIVGTYSFVNEAVLLAHAKRRAEFTIKLANGEIILSGGRVYKQTKMVEKDGVIHATYAPVALNQDEFDALSKKILDEGKDATTEKKPSLIGKAKAAFKRKPKKK